MPQPADMVYLRMQFDLSSDAGIEDQAVFGVYGVFNWAPATSGDWDTALGLLATEARSAWTSVPKTKYSPAVGLSGAKATRQDTAGHALNEGQDSSSGGSWVGSASASLPWECSLCVGLYTYARGSFVPGARRRRGRVYLPPLGTVAVSIDSKAGRLNSTDSAALMTSFGTWLKTVSNTDLGASGHNWDPGVLSKAGNAFHALTHLSVDTKVDSQRRREKQLSAFISNVDYPGGV